MESFEQPPDRLNDDSPLGSEEASTLFFCPGGCQATGVDCDHGLLIFVVTVELQSLRRDRGKLKTALALLSKSKMFLLEKRSSECCKPLTNFQTSEKLDLKMFVRFLIDFMEKKTFESHYSAIFH